MYFDTFIIFILLRGINKESAYDSLNLRSVNLSCQYNATGLQSVSSK